MKNKLQSYNHLTLAEDTSSNGNSRGVSQVVTEAVDSQLKEDKNIESHYNNIVVYRVQLIIIWG